MVLAGTPESAISQRLPANTTIDWFDPAYFNALPAVLRAQYAKADVALPPEGHQHEPFKNMKRNEFMRRYGNGVREAYTFPTQEELERMEKDELEPDTSDDEPEDQDDDGMGGDEDL